jgi:hypothetical protein
VRAAGGEPATAVEVREACATTDIALKRGKYSRPVAEKTRQRPR